MNFRRKMTFAVTVGATAVAAIPLLAQQRAGQRSGRPL